MVRYDAADGGFFTAQRDQVAKTQAHRRFVMRSLNLNTPETRGRRYVRLSFLFDEESRRFNDRF